MKTYKGRLKVTGPVFVGSGQELTKKEYIYDRKSKRVIVPKISHMYMGLQKLHLAKEYEKFVLCDGKKDLSAWLGEKKVPSKEIEEWKSYDLDCGDAVWENKMRMQIMAFTKDPYGNPYVPGSSIKGMLRTILLNYDIITGKENYRGLIQDNDRAMERKMNRNRYLARETKSIEQQAFHKAKRTDKRSDMTNDILAGLMIGDSEPLCQEDLTLCQKLEYHVDGSTKRLNLLRECLKPGTEIVFPITIDETLCPVTIEVIEQAISEFSDLVYRHFIQKFPDTDRPSPQTVWLGGGAGYLSKTITYALYGKEGVAATQQIFEFTNVSSKHKHHLDKKLGVSPHILKRTQYRGKMYSFGECHWSVESF